MKNILLFGAGKSSSVLITYLLQNAPAEKWFITIIDNDLSLIKTKIGNSLCAKGISFDIHQIDERQKHIANSNIVISLLPPALHFLIASDCLDLGKNLLTASYIDEQMRSLQPQIEKKGLLFLCEMGLDPGIDHMSAKKLIDTLQKNQSKITSFLSHCGGLLAPESDDNPWHYKISWNPLNIVQAGKSGAVFKKDNAIITLGYKDLFAEKRYVSIPDFQELCWYPNRDSLTYIQSYGLSSCATFIRTTLRHPDFIYGWKNIIDLELTDELKTIQTNNLSLASFFKSHMVDHGFSEWLEQRLRNHFSDTKGLLTELINLAEIEQKAAGKGLKTSEEFMMVDDKGSLKEIDIDDLKINAAATLADKMHEASLTLKQLFYLGMKDESTIINKGLCSASDIMRFALETKLGLQNGDKDMVIMVHEIEFENQGHHFKTISSLLVKGENASQTAMAKTVGLPLGIAAKMVLEGTINLTGLHIPIREEIYEPVLKELQEQGIIFKEQTIKLS
ncbi:MAG: saccharopine dehydrogenase C-terminal domain-containing protein [Flavisolibacter sp.]